MSASSSSHNSVLRFGAFEFDPRTGILRKNSRSIALPPQPGKVLSLLISRPGELITREEIRVKVWGEDTFVDFEHSINFAVRQIREALKDDAERPRFVETLPRRGYRFIASVEEAAVPQTGLRGGRTLPAQRHSVGRAKELQELRTAFESAAAGHGFLLCFAGEPGIGKTTLVQDFLLGLQAEGEDFDLAVGRCSQRLAGEEAYLPFLEAIESMLRSNDSAKRRLREFAPSWYAQLFPLSESDPSDARLQEYVATTTQERVKRELATFLQEVTRQEPLVLFFDDVHWTDASTVDLLAHLATRFDSTRILVVVTYRQSELLLSKHPFTAVKCDLQSHGVCREVEVEFLSAAEVERYIALEFPDNSFPGEFAKMIHSRTEGNPLFMVALLRHLCDGKVIVKTEGSKGWRLAQSLPDLGRDFPQTVGNIIERRMDQLSDFDREVLMTGAVQGYEFDSACLALALKINSMEIEEALDRVERVHGLIKRTVEAEFPDGTLTVRCRFVHVLYQNALYSFLTATRRTVLSGALAHALEGFYGDKHSAVASQLGFLYETARDPGRASDFFLLAARNAQRLFANQEAIALSRRGLRLLIRMPDGSERTRKELGLQVTLAFSLLFTRGYGASEVQENMTRARELCESLGDRSHLFPILFGLWLYYITSPQLQSARRTAERMLEIANEAESPILILAARATLGIALQHLGNISAAQTELDAAVTLHEPQQHKCYLELFRMEPGINARGQIVRTLWMLGYPDQARRRSEATVLLAQTIPSPPSLAFALMHAAFLFQHLRQPERAKQIAEECVAVCDQHGVAQERAWVMLIHGWAIAQIGQVAEGIGQIRAGLDAQLSTGGQIARPQFVSFLVETYQKVGHVKEGLQLIEQTLAAAEQTGDNYYDAELWRLRGELLKIQDKTAVAENSFQKAIEIARHQAAKSLELRACTSLGRLWQVQGKRKEAQQLLCEIYAWFTEGFDTADLTEAASLLAELS